MAIPNYHAKNILARFSEDTQSGQTFNNCRPRLPEEKPLPPRIMGTRDYSQVGLVGRRDLLQRQGISVEQVSGQGEEISPEDLSGNIENLIGFARVPIGIIGPLRINGLCACDDFYIPLATTEGAMVASYHRGAQVISRAGGAIAGCLTESVARAPCFIFNNLTEAGLFMKSVLPRYDQLQEIVAGTSNHCKLIDMRPTIIGKEVYLLFEFATGDAAGQNMVTIATQAICRVLVDWSAVKPKHMFLDGNLSGDKKATMLGFTYARGKKVLAEVTIDRKLVRRFLHVEPEQMVRYWQISIMGGIQSGSIGVQGHFANALAGLFIACGQDVATVAEAAVGMTRMDMTDEGGLYVSVSLPNLIVGTVGGGTTLPTARECLEILGCYGSGKARKFAEICAATVLAGEVSIIGAMAAGDFGQAHANYGRKQQSSRNT